MAKPNVLPDRLEEHRKGDESLENTLLRLLNQYGSIPATAEALGTSDVTVMHAARRANIRKNVIVEWTKTADIDHEPA